MTVVDASVAIKWFVTEEPLVDKAVQVLNEVGRDPAPYGVPDLLMNVALAALSDGVWMTADARAASRIPKSSLVQLLGA